MSLIPAWSLSSTRVALSIPSIGKWARENEEAKFLIVDAPFASFRRMPQRRSEPLEKNSSRHLARPKPQHMLGRHLRVDKMKPPPLQSLNQRGEGYLGAIRFVMEHRFAKECFTQRNAVKPAGQFAVDPAFHRVGKPQTMKLDVCFLHLRCDPSAALSFPWDRSAGANHFFKSAVKSNPEDFFLNGFAHAPRELEVFKLQNQARIRRPPKNWLLVRIPGE